MAAWPDGVGGGLREMVMDTTLPLDTACNNNRRRQQFDQNGAARQSNYTLVHVVPMIESTSHRSALNNNYLLTFTID